MNHPSEATKRASGRSRARVARAASGLLPLDAAGHEPAAPESPAMKSRHRILGGGSEGTGHHPLCLLQRMSLDVAQMRPPGRLRACPLSGADRPHGADAYQFLEARRTSGAIPSSERRHPQRRQGEGTPRGPGPTCRGHRRARAQVDGLELPPGSRRGSKRASAGGEGARAAVYAPGDTRGGSAGNRMPDRNSAVAQLGTKPTQGSKSDHLVAQR
jgi:hypothetical protein